MAELIQPLLTEREISARIAEMAKEIQAAHPEEDLILVGVLKGSIYFLTQLSLELGKLSSGKVQLEFMQVASYHGEKSSSGIVEIRKDLAVDIAGRNVIIVEDIVDTGLTLSFLYDYLQDRSPKSLEIATLLSKLQARNSKNEVKAPIKYLGFEIPDKFVVGFGLDYAERYRNLAYIGIFQG